MNFNTKTSKKQQIFKLITVKMHTGYSVPVNTTKIQILTWVKYILFGFQTSTEYEYEYYSGLDNHANMNTNTNTSIFSFEK